MANKRIMKKLAKQAANVVTEAAPAPAAVRAPVNMAPHPRAINRTTSANPTAIRKRQQTKSENAYRRRVGQQEKVAQTFSQERSRPVSRGTRTPKAERTEARRLRQQEKTSRKQVEAETSSRQRKDESTSSRKRKDESTGGKNRKLLDEMGSYDGLFKPIAGTLATGARSATSFLKQEGNLKKAGIGMVQSSAASAAGHGGLAALQGEDPWEAAKTGAIRGAMIGGGYQGLKAATHADRGSLRKNLKHIGSTSKDLHRANTSKGNAAMQSSGISSQLARVLEQGKRVENSSGIFGF